ncbi:unnamed protein product [Ambrosiozyma monospora]|uniref:Unnamed protein product n=1 Tax=Ambrosiozyma monospora TaxID=43982 RepID=A0ACB5SWR3_AMBMO|nr:unnamed protein product [Ambrosiozyma monospora]
MVINSLLTNKSLFLDPYIHALMPCVLTLLLAKKIGPTQGTPDELNSHLNIRGFAAQLLGKMIEQYGSSYNTLKPRVTRTLLRAFLGNTTKNSVGTQYGAIKGMKYLGSEVIRIIMVGNLNSWSISVLDNLDKNDENRKKLVDSVYECLSDLAKDAELIDGAAKKRKLNNEDSMDVDSLTEEQKEKLVDRVGKILADEILSRDNSVAVYKGIFFGEE